MAILGGVVGAVSKNIVGTLIDGYGYPFTFTMVAEISLAASTRIYLTLEKGGWDHPISMAAPKNSPKINPQLKEMAGLTYLPISAASLQNPGPPYVLK